MDATQSTARCEHLADGDLSFKCVDCGFVGCPYCVSITTPQAALSMKGMVAEASSLRWDFRCKPCSAVLKEPSPIEESP